MLAAVPELRGPCARPCPGVPSEGAAEVSEACVPVSTPDASPEVWQSLHLLQRMEDSMPRPHLLEAHGPFAQTDLNSFKPVTGQGIKGGSDLILR